MSRLLLGMGALVFAAALAWAVLLPAGYSCPPNSQMRLIRVTPGGLRPACIPQGVLLGHPTVPSRDDRVPLRVGLAIGGATLGAGLMVLGRRRRKALVHLPN